MEIRCEIARIGLTLDGKAEVSFTAPRDCVSHLEELKGKDLTMKLSQFYKRRSLSQNAYLWVLLGQLAEKLGLSKEEVYRNFIKDYGSYEVLPIKAEAVDKFISTWKSHGIGWVCERLRESKLGGFVNVIAYYGSSCYDSNSMKRLLDAVIQECADQGITTMSMRDIMLLQNENDDTI